MVSQHPAVRRVTGDTGRTEYHVLAAPGWDDGDALARYFVKQFGATMLRQMDGVWTREWSLQVGKHVLHLEHNDDIGNYFYSPFADRVADELLQGIADDLSARLSSIVPPR